MISLKFLRCLVNIPLWVGPAACYKVQSSRTVILPVIYGPAVCRSYNRSRMKTRAFPIVTNKLAFLPFLSCLWIALLAPPGFCDQTDVLIDKALNQSGLSGQLESFAPSVVSAVPDDAFPNAKAKGEIGAFMKKSVGKDRLLPLVREAVRENFNRKMIEQVIEFYDSKLGRKVGRLQGNTLSPALLKTVREGRKTTAAMDETRLNFLRRIIKAEHVAQYNRRLLHSFAKGLIEGPQDAPGSHNPTSREGLETVEDGIRFDKARAEEIALVALSHTYRSLNDKELEELTAHKESEPGVWFGSTLQKGLNRAAYETGKALGEAVYASRRR
jgi:hypothetical protein